MCQRLFAVYQLRFFSVHERSKAQTKFISVYRLPTQACVCVCVCVCRSLRFGGERCGSKRKYTTQEPRVCVCVCMFV